MIYQNSTVTINKGTATIDSPIILYRGDREVEINFTIQNSPFKYRTENALNLIEQTEADFAQLIIKTPNNRPPIFSKITATYEGKVILKITADMIDEIEEVGKYDFQIRLFDNEQISKATIPEVLEGIEIREPIAIEDEAPISDTNEVNVAKVNYAVTTTSEVLDSFDSEGNYIETNWQNGDLITESKLNKIEKGITGVNNKLPSKTSDLTNDSGFLTSIPSEYVTETELNSKGYLTEHQDISGLALKTEIPSKTSDLTNDSNFVNETYVTNKIAEAQLAGGEKEWTLLQDITLTEDISIFIANSLQLKELKLVYQNKTGGDVAGWVDMNINDNGQKGRPNITIKDNAVFILEVNLYDNLILKSFLNNVVDFWVNGFSQKRECYYEYLNDEYINKITFGSTNLLKTNCTIKIYGR